MFFIFATIVILLAWVAATIALKTVKPYQDYDDRRAGKEPTPYKVWPAHVIALVLFTLLSLFNSITTVGTGEIAVMTRFGRVTGQELDEGLHLKLPIDKANKYDVKVQREEVKAAAASKDLQDINSTLVLNYSLREGEVDEIHRTLGNEYREKVIDPALQEVFKASTARYDATQVITNRAEVKSLAVKLLRERLESFGITVVDLNITNFSFSKEFSAAIEDKQVAQQRAQRAQFNLEAARIDAEAQQVQATTLSPLYLQKLFLEKWNGRLPQVLGSDAGVLVDLLQGTQP